jgi:hypothetical protein
MVGGHRKPALLLGAAMVLAGCATKQAPGPVAGNAQQAAGIIAGRAPLGAGVGATGVVDENYLYDQHQKARQQSTKSAPSTPQPPWSPGP